MPKTKPKYHTSASAQVSFDSCKRLWFFAKVAGLTKPQTAPLIFGTDFHTAIEDVIQGFLPDTDDEKILKMLDNNPDLIGQLQVWENKFVEKEIRFPITEDTEFLGYIDVLRIDEENKIIYIDDFKTVGDWKWALTVEALGRDLQMNLYALWANLKFPGYRVILSHYQFNKKTCGKCRTIRVEQDPKYSLELFEQVIENIAKMELMYKNDITDWVKIVPNLDACNNYGGCPFFDICHRNKTFEKGDSMEKSHPRMLKNSGGSSSAKANEVLERLRNKKNGKKEEEKPVKKESPLERLRNKKKLKATIVSETGVREVEIGIDEKGEVESINQNPEKESPLDKLRRKKKEKKAVGMTVVSQEAVEVVDGGMLVGEIPKEILGRDVPEVITGEIKPKKKSKTMEKVKADNVTCHFYMNCMPLLREYQLFSEILKPYIVKVEKENKTQSIHLIGFNEGIKSLARFKKDIYADCRKWDHVVIDNFEQVFGFLPTNHDKDMIIKGM